MRVRIFRNLHRRLFSVQARMAGSGWRTVAWCKDALLENTSMHVSQAGRRRTLLLGRRCVHAFVEGELLAWGDGTCRLATGTEFLSTLGNIPLHLVDLGTVRYSPWEAGSFVHDGSPVHAAPLIRMSEGRLISMVASP